MYLAFCFLKVLTIIKQIGYQLSNNEKQYYFYIKIQRQYYIYVTETFIKSLFYAYLLMIFQE